MNLSMISLLAGQRHQLGAIVLMRGETYMETIEPGGMALLVIFRGTATISRQRVGAMAGLHITPRCGQPVHLTAPGTYCVVTKDFVLGARLLKIGGTP